MEDKCIRMEINKLQQSGPSGAIEGTCRAHFFGVFGSVTLLDFSTQQGGFVLSQAITSHWSVNSGLKIIQFIGECFWIRWGTRFYKGATKDLQGSSGTQGDGLPLTMSLGCLHGCCHYNNILNGQFTSSTKIIQIICFWKHLTIHMFWMYLSSFRNCYLWFSANTEKH